MCFDLVINGRKIAQCVVSDTSAEQFNMYCSYEESGENTLMIITYQGPAAILWENAYGKYFPMPLELNRFKQKKAHILQIE